MEDLDLRNVPNMITAKFAKPTVNSVFAYKWEFQ